MRREARAASTDELGGSRVVRVLAGGSSRSFGGGDDTWLALTEAGGVYLWGRGKTGVLGSGDTHSVSTGPRPVATLRGETIVDAALHDHALVVSSLGRVFSCGANEHGQCGHGDTISPRPVMRSLAALHSRRIVSVAAGKRHSLAVDEDGVVFAWGDGSSGQLGLGDRAGRTAPTVIRWLTEKSIVVKEVYAGQARSFVRCATGVVYCFGSNNDGALGLELQYDQLLPALLDLNPQSTAATVMTTPRTPRDSAAWRGVSDGGTPVDVTQVVKPAAVRPSYSQSTSTPPALPSTTPPLGLSSSWRESSSASIRRVAEGAHEYEVRLLATGHESTIAVTSDGSVFVFGTLGDTRLINPTVVLTEHCAPLNGRLREVSAGYRSATLVTEAGEALVWSLGKGAFDPHEGQVRAPEPLTVLAGHRVVSASSGNSNFVAVVEVSNDDNVQRQHSGTDDDDDDDDHDVDDALFPVDNLE